MRFSNQAALSIALIAALSFPLIAAENDDDLAPEMTVFMESHCVRCHGNEKQEGALRMDSLSRDFSDLQIAQRWAEVMFRINSGEMPPNEERQPTAPEIEAIVDWISAGLKAGEAARMAQRGTISHYRLSRDEYADTIYDLLGVRFDVNAPGAFNEDPRWHGFERVGSMLSLSPSHVDRYFKAAEIVLERAFPDEQPPTQTLRSDAIQMRHHQEREKFAKAGFADKVRDLVWPGGSLDAYRPWHGELKSGVYRVRIRLSGLPGLDGRAPHLSVWNPDLKRSLCDEDILATEDNPAVIEFESFFSMPVQLDIRNEVPDAFNPTGNHTLNVLYGGGSVFTGSRDTQRLNPTGYKLFDDDGKAIYPLLIVDSMEWEGPIVSEADQNKRAGLLPENDGDLREARQCLQRFASRAWRRPATDTEVSRYVKIVESELAVGEKFSAAYRAAMTGILTSKNFYYLEEGSPTERRAQVTDWELASRLSYFLWGSMPDAELFAAAQTGELHTQNVLRSQFARMLEDPKSKRFTDAFPRQWLQLHKIGMFPPDPQLYRGYDLWLEKSMAMEPVAFFTEVFTKNLPLRDLLNSDWAMVNPRLVQHYGMPPLKESGFQRVSLRPEDHRGGLLTQAGVLMLTSDGTRHRPVHRGVWVSEAIFGKTPPPPPPNVQALEPTRNDKPKATVRMQIEAHATDATCAACHRKIDPLGFAFDNYDAIGRWRSEESSTAGQGSNPAVDASGKLADGREFTGPEDLKALLAQDIDRVAEAFVEQLATFALRRVMTVDESSQIKAITVASKNDDYRLKTVIENFVTSDLFQKR